VTDFDIWLDVAMQLTVTIAQWTVRITGVLLLILGLLFWGGDARNLISVHILLGIVMVFALLLLAVSATQLGIPIGMAAGAAIMALITLVLGLTQDNLLPGPSHWIIQILHLIVGVLAVGSGEMIGGRLRRMRVASIPSSA
jgi:hypothetical protein